MCNYSITLERNTDYERKVPCGRCMRCKATNSASWLFRLQQEVNVNSYPWYVTFTYNDNHLPKIWTNDGNEVMTLDYEDIKKYFKRLRKNTKLDNIRYFCVGEYGSKRGRPHYHAIIFNVPNMQDIVDNWNAKGFVYVEPFNPMLGGGAYLTKYLCKDVSDFNKKEIVKPKLLVSKGFGKQYITEAVKNWHLENPYQNSYVVANGQKVPMPRYLKDKIFGTKNENRELVTSAMQDLSRKLSEAEFIKMRKRFPTKDDDFIQNMLNINKLSKNFDTFNKSKMKHYGEKSRNIQQ